MEPVLKMRIPYPKVGSGRFKRQLVTMNNWSSLYWPEKSKIKNSLKAALHGWFLEENKEEKYEWLELRFKIIRQNKRKLDALNPAPLYKVIEDALTDLGYVKDDDKNKIILEPSQYEEGLSEAMLEIEVRGKR